MTSFGGLAQPGSGLRRGLASAMAAAAAADAGAGDGGSVFSLSSSFAGRCPKGEGCRFCRRKWTSINPIKREREDHPQLRRRRERGQECRTCVKVIAEEYAEYAGKKDDLDKQMEEESFYSGFMALVDTIEEEENEGGRQGRKRKASAAFKSDGAGDNMHSGKQVRVTVNDHHGIECRKKIGVFWPAKLYESHFKQRAPKAKLTSCPDGSTNVKGVMMPSTAGFMDGCTEVFGVHRQEAVKGGVLWDSTTARRDGSGQALWDVARGSLALKSKVKGEGDKQYLSLSTGGTKRSRKGEDADPLDAVWAENFFSGAESDAESDDGQGGKKKKKKTRTSAASSGGGGGNGGPQTTPSKAKAAKPKAGGSPGQLGGTSPENKTAGAGMTDARRAREVDSAEQVALAAEQMLRQLGSERVFAGVTVKSHDALAAKIKARMSPHLIKAYSSDFNPTTGNSSAGTDLVARLKSLQKSIDGVGGLVASINNPACLAADLLHAKNSAEAETPGEVSFDSVNMRVLERRVEQCAGQSDWPGVCYACDCLQENLPKPEGAAAEISISSLGGLGDTEALQEKFLLTTMSDVMLKEGAVDDVVRFIDSCDISKVTNAEVREELKDLAKVADPWGVSDVEALREAAGAFKNPAKKLHKPLQLFPTGSQLLDICEQVRGQRLQDDQLLKDLDALKPPQALSASVFKQLVQEAGVNVTLPEPTMWKGYVEGLTGLKARGSANFKTQHGHVLAQADQHIQDVASVVSAAHFDLFGGRISAVLEKFCSACQERSDGDWEAFKTECKRTIEQAPSAQGLLLDHLGQDSS